MVLTPSRYHRDTSYDRRQMSGHYLDWENQPAVYKTYEGVDPIELPREVQFPDATLSHLLKSDFVRNKAPTSLTKETLSRILLLTYSLTAKTHHGGATFYYRSAASAGALYPTEIYVAAKGLKDLDDGLYHFSIARHGLNLIRKGDSWVTVTGATGSGDVPEPMVAFFFSAIFFRSAWKYRERAYRYHLLDTGHVVEHLVLALKAMDLPHRLSYDFPDREMAYLLGLDPSREVCLAFCRLSERQMMPVKGDGEISELPAAFQKASRMARLETDYPLIRRMHAAGTTTMSPVKPVPEMNAHLGPNPGRWKSDGGSVVWPEKANFAESVFRRRSRRNYVKVPMDSAAMIGLLEGLCAQAFEPTGTDHDYLRSLSIGFLARDIEGFDPGFYLIDQSKCNWGLVAPGVFTDRMARVCLDQLWLAGAAAHFLFMTNLERVDRQWGPRGYRYAMMTAGRMGERLYLMAASFGLGCCGIGAFYDKEAAGLLSLADHSCLLYLVAVGPVKKA